MSISTSAAKDLKLNADDSDTLRLHTADAGAAGTSNEISGNGYAPISVAFAAPSAHTGTSRKRNLTEAKTVSGPVGAVASHWSLWAGSTFRQRGAFASPATFNADGLIRIPTTFAIVQSDPS
jgi:hypothetical protein